MPRQRRPRNDPHFEWRADDITIVLPPTLQTELDEEQHTILWSLEHVSNKQGLSEVMPNVANYMADHPTDQLVSAAVERAEQRVEHSS